MAKDKGNIEQNLMLIVAKKYYELGMTQERIAEETFISKSSVCRLLKKAEASGIVRFQINYPIESVQNLEEELLKHFQLDRVFVAPRYTEDLDLQMKETCRYVASELSKIVHPPDTLCVSWGTTMDQLATLMLKDEVANKKCSKIVMMNGSIAANVDSTKSARIIEQFAEYFKAEGYLLPVPLIMDSKEAADLIKCDSHISYVMDYAKKAEIALFSIGATSQESVLRRRGAYSKEDYDTVLALGAVGDIAGHCFDSNGQSVSRQIDERMIGLDIREIKAKKIRMGVAIGPKKAKAIIGALRGGIVNRLYTDESTAQTVIKLLKH